MTSPEADHTPEIDASESHGEEDGQHVGHGARGSRGGTGRNARARDRTDALLRGEAGAGVGRTQGSDARGVQLRTDQPLGETPAALSTPETDAVEHVHPGTLPCLAGCPAYGTRQGAIETSPDQYREQSEALIADLRARVSHYEALLVAVREETLTDTALAVEQLALRVADFDTGWDRGYRQAIKDAAYAIRELSIRPGQARAAGEL